MGTRLTSVVFDGLDWEGLARRFWGPALGWDLADEFLVHNEAVLRPRDAAPIELIFLPADRPKLGKNRLHLDLAPQDDQARFVEKLNRLGASAIDIGQQDVPWIVMADPEGNEFCVTREPDPGRSLVAVCLDAADPEAQGAFWSTATGWPIETRTPDHVVLRAPWPRGPAMSMGPEVAPKRGKNRGHLDVAPFPGGDTQVEVERLLAAGARRVDIGQGDVPWVVLADPEDNELCVLSPR